MGLRVLGSLLDSLLSAAVFTVLCSFCFLPAVGWRGLGSDPEKPSVDTGPIECIHSVGIYRALSHLSGSENREVNRQILTCLLEQMPLRPGK